MPTFNSTVSLLCANCHGADGNGGAAQFVIQSEDPSCEPGAAITEELARTKPECLPTQVAWQAPSLKLAALRYTRKQLLQIVTYGRPGTPMPAWGVASGRGALNKQSISDLVNYIESISADPAKAKNDAAKAVTAVRADAAKNVQTLQDTLNKARAALAALPSTASVAQRSAAQATVTKAEGDLAGAQDWNRQMQAASDGQILFQNNCARCHTKGWSYFDPSDVFGKPKPATQGSGRYGPNLTNGDVNRQFPSPAYDESLYNWIALNVEANGGYGLGGISSGRMPHFADTLTEDQIKAIIAYIRTL
jgi:mono/diheme cytochrome c family protein